MQVHDNHYVKERLLSQKSKQILTPTLSLISNILSTLKFRKELVRSKGFCDYIQKKIRHFYQTRNRMGCSLTHFLC